MKQRIQGAVFGFLAAVLLLGTVTVVTAATRTIEVTHDVNVVVDGVRQNFPDDMLPFRSEGRIFLPIRGIANALGLDVNWVSSTSTAYLTSPTPATAPAPQPEPPPAPSPVQRAYLETDIFRVSASVHIHNYTQNAAEWRTFPDSGMFTIYRTDYLRGMVLVAADNPYLPDDINANASIVYDIGSMGFTRLSGTFSFSYLSNRNERGILTVSCADSGRVLGSYTATNPFDSDTSAPIEVDVDISGIERVRIMMELSGDRVEDVAGFVIGVGFGDAAFE